MRFVSNSAQISLCPAATENQTEATHSHKTLILFFSKDENSLSFTLQWMSKLLYPVEIREEL